MTKLKLGPIEDDKPVKLTTELRGSTLRTLTDYARAHAEATGQSNPVPVEKLIDPIVERFIATDRAFMRQRRTTLRS